MSKQTRYRIKKTATAENDFSTRYKVSEPFNSRTTFAPKNVFAKNAKTRYFIYPEYIEEIGGKQYAL
jgi:hypothetical protein